MPEAFDTGPLTWVKDEIFQSLEKVLRSFYHVAEQPSEFASLRFTEAHLYQISGALDMVGLEGCKRYCSEIEKLTHKIEKGTIPVTADLMANSIDAIETLRQYIQDLLNGMPDRPLKLYDSLKPLVNAQDTSLDESELFFPDTTFAAPKNLPTHEIDDAALVDFISSQRGIFQKALLDWLRTQDQASLATMQSALDAVLSVQQKNAHKTMCWVATALVDALAQEKIASHPGAKKVCRKLDQYLRNMTLGDYKIPAHLLRDALYYVALSAPSTPLINQVKNTFELEDLLPTDAALEIAPTHVEDASIAQLNALMPMLKDLWSAVSEGKLSEINSFQVKLSVLDATDKKLNQDTVISLCSTLHQYALLLNDNHELIDDSALLEVAATLNLLEFIADRYPALDLEAQQKIATQQARLNALVAGETLSTVGDDLAQTSLDASVVEAVAKQVLDALQKVEKIFDGYFRQPENAQVLVDVTQPLNQVVAAFEMLDMPVPMHIAKHANTFAVQFQQAYIPDPAVYFELLAESLSMLSLFAEALPVIRSEALHALVQAESRMQTGLDEINAKIKVEDAATTLAAPPDIEPVVLDVVNKENDSLLLSNLAHAVEDSASVDRAIDEELLSIFLTEGEEVLAALAENLQALRVNLTDANALSEVRRAYHTLKGSGRTVGLTRLGDVAWVVENLLNDVIEQKAFITGKQLNFIEETTASFASWLALLEAQREVSVNPVPFTEKATALTQDAEVSAKPVAEEVLIDGTHKLSRTFYNIFMAEAEQHLATLLACADDIILQTPALPNAAMHLAAHTLGSNALTAGFKPMGDLARALELWVDTRDGVWLDADKVLYENAVNALEKAVAKAKQYKNIRTARALIKALAKASENTSKASYAEVSSNEIVITDDAMVETDSVVRFDNEVVLESVGHESALFDVATVTPDTLSVMPPDTDSSKRAAAQTVDQELLALFVEEARDLVPQVGRDLRGWRANPADTEYSDALQRALHTLKGSARMAGQARIGDSVHAIEDLVIRALKRQVTLGDFDEMFAEFDRVGYMLEDITGNNKISQAMPESTEQIAPATRTADRKSQFLRLRADVLDRLINEAGEVSIMRARMDREMQSFKQSSTDLTESITRLRAYLRELEIEAETQLQSRMSLLQEANEQFDPLEFDRFTRLQELTRMMAESVNDVATIQHGLLLNLDQTDAALQQQNRMNRELQQGLMSVRMLPFATISERLQRIVRQTARELNKRVELHISGETIEIDRGVLDKIGAPLEHLLRNAVAHGLEDSQTRQHLGKDEVGHITLNVTLENDEITLVITDDGAGVDLAKVKQKALARGMLNDAQDISNEALMAVIFEPGFSTAETISQIAGRGVGLDAVRSDIATLGGRIDVSNVVGKGAMFNIYLPVTLSVAQVVMVRVGQKTFAVPSVMVEQVQKLKPTDLTATYLAHKVTWAERDYPMHYLAKLIGDTELVAQQHQYTPVLLLRSGTYRSAVHVDEIIGNQEVVMKQMGTQLARVPGMIGATVLGDGAIVLVINPVQLANREALQVGAVKVTATAPHVEAVKPVALVVDDSLTMRKVLSRLLEREGFEVVTANDGMDAVQKLQTLTPHIILTDIEMPRMDGFEFSRHVRDNAATAHTPLIVISSRTAEKHRNVATALGVNAFLGKPVQDDELISQVNALLKVTLH